PVSSGSATTMIANDGRFMILPFSTSARWVQRCLLERRKLLDARVVESVGLMVAARHLPDVDAAHDFERRVHRPAAHSGGSTDGPLEPLRAWSGLHADAN